MGGETDEFEEVLMKWRNWEVIFWFPLTAWMCNKGVWPNERETLFKFWNVAFVEVRMFLTPQERVCKKCGQELP